MARERPRVAAALDEINERINANVMLTEEEKEAARQKARDHVAEKRKRDALDAYLAKEIDKEERSYILEEQMEDILVDLPKFAHFINLDNVGFYHGLTYTVRYSQARSMYEIMGMAWAHQREIEGDKRRGDNVRTPRELKISPAQQSLPADVINRTNLPRI
jgi:hypothetical protein